MFEVGFTEIVLILGLALLVLGPEKLPGLAQKIGRWTGRARSMARQLRTQLEQEVTLDEITRSRPPTGATQAADPAPEPYNEPKEEPQSHAEPAHSGPGLDLDRHVSGIEPEPPPPASTVDSAHPKSVQ